MSSSYARLMGQLAAESARYASLCEEAEHWYQRQCASAERALADAAQDVRHAEQEIASAQEQAEATDTEVMHLWHTLLNRLDSARRRLGDPPVPVPGAPADPAVLLDTARKLIDRAKHPGDLPSAAYPLLVVIGILGAAAAYAFGLAARAGGERVGGDVATGMPVLALVITLVGPVVGLAPAKLLAERRHANLDLRAVLMVVAAGLLTTGVLFGLLR